MSEGRRRWAFGPGLVFVLAAVGPQDIISNAAAGATYGYKLLWVLSLVVLARYAILEASARYVVVTGETLMTGYARAGRWVIWAILGAILVKRHLSALFQLLLMGGAIHMLLPLPTKWSVAVWGLASWTLAFSMMYWGRYRLVEKTGKPLLVVLGGSLALAAVFSRPDLAAVAAGTFLPSIPGEGGVYSRSMLLLALVGAGAGGLSNLKYASFVHEKGWTGTAFLPRQRMDLLLSALGLFLMLFLIQVAAAAVLQGTGTRLRTIEDLLPMFQRSLGAAGVAVLAVGMWTAVFTTAVGATTGYSLLVCDIWWNTLGKGSPAGRLGESRTFQWWILWFGLSPLYVLLTDWKPVGLVLLEAMLMAVLLPVVVPVLLWLTRSRERMGDHANGWVSTLMMVFAIVVTAYLTYENAGELWARLGG